MEIREGRLKDGTKYLRIASVRKTDLAGSEVVRSYINDREEVQITYQIGEKIREAEEGGKHYAWYRVTGKEKTQDKSQYMIDMIAEMEELIVQNQFEITLLQLGIVED